MAMTGKGMDIFKRYIESKGKKNLLYTNTGNIGGKVQTSRTM